MRNEKEYALAGKKLFVAIPSYDSKISLKSATSMVCFAQEALKHGIGVVVGSVSGCSIVSRARNILVQDFMESDCTELLFIDTDINFEPEAIIRLIAWLSEPHVDVVAGIPCMRKADKVYSFVVETKANNEFIMDDMGLVKVERAPTAFMAVKKTVFKTLISNNPKWFYYDDNSTRRLSAVFDFAVENERYIGEDFLFCDRARKHGFSIWADPAIKLGHMGVEEFKGSFGEDWLYPRLQGMVGTVNKEAA
jgi:hypothetical protein